MLGVRGRTIRRNSTSCRPTRCLSPCFGCCHRSRHRMATSQQAMQFCCGLERLAGFCLTRVIDKMYRERWGPEDGVGCIILSPANDLAGQIFEVINKVGQFHNFSAGAIVGKRKGIEQEKEHVNSLNILVCTPGRKQMLVLDEADQILDHGFKSQVDAIISQILKVRQTLLFSATQNEVS